MNNFEIMKQMIAELPKVKYVDIQFNETWGFDHFTQIPPKSFRVVVEGGKKKAIANIIWAYKPPGVLSMGNTSVKIKTTVSGLTYIVNFERVFK